MEAARHAPHRVPPQGGHPRQSAPAPQPPPWGPPTLPRKGPRTPPKSSHRHAWHIAEEVEIVVTRRPCSIGERTTRSVLLRPRSDHLGHGSAAKPDQDSTHPWPRIYQASRDGGGALGEGTPRRHHPSGPLGLCWWHPPAAARGGEGGGSG
jgi:hypothetical protein